MVRHCDDKIETADRDGAINLAICRKIYEWHEAGSSQHHCRRYTW